MKILKVICLRVLILYICASFTSNKLSSKKEILFEGKIVLKDKWYNAYTQFSINQKKGKIISLKVKTTAALFFKEIGEIEIQKLNKNDSTQLSISKDIDKHMSIYLSHNFSHEGGLITVSIKKSNGKVGFEKFYIAPSKDKFKAYRDSIAPLQKINGLDVIIVNEKVEDYFVKISSL
jgi:hypothetical protein